MVVGSLFVGFVELWGSGEECMADELTEEAEECNEEVKRLNIQCGVRSGKEGSRGAKVWRDRKE